jgi:transposase
MSSLQSQQNLRTLHLRVLLEEGIRDPHILQNRSGASTATVYRLLSRRKKGMRSPKKRKPGPPPVLSPVLLKVLRKEAKRNPRHSNNLLAVELKRRGVPLVSRWTVGRGLQSLDMTRKRPRPVPFMTEGHIEKRLAWCLQNQGRDWSRVIFTDESRFQFFQNKKRVICKMTGPAPVDPRQKFPPAVMVWGGISLQGATPLAVVKGTIGSLEYQEILDGFLFPTMEVLYPQEEANFVLQQDNAPCHSSKSTRTFL